MANDNARQEPAETGESRLDETHGVAEIAIMVDEDGSTVFGTIDDDLGGMYEGEHGTTDQSKDRYVVQVYVPKARTKNAAAVIPQGASAAPKIVIEA